MTNIHLNTAKSIHSLAVETFSLDNTGDRRFSTRSLNAEHFQSYKKTKTKKKKKSGIHSSLHSNCHHQIVFGKFNLSIFYPPPYERTVWYYEKANTELIRRAIDQFDWRALSNVNVDEKVYFFTKTLLNIIQNFIPHETTICDDRDPPWINNEIKKLMTEKNVAFKSYCCSNRNMFLLEKFKAFAVSIAHIYQRIERKVLQ